MITQVGASAGRGAQVRFLMAGRRRVIFTLVFSSERPNGAMRAKPIFAAYSGELADTVLVEAGAPE